jgi:hypothetical protein
MVHGINNQVGIQTFNQVDHGNNQPEQTGNRSIGEKIASFFSAVGSALAAPFKAIGNAIASLFAHGDNAPTGNRGVTASFTTQEKEQLLEECLNSEFYQHVSKDDSTLSASQFRDSAMALLNTPESVKAMKEHGVTLAEAVAISMYTSQSYREINDQLRSGNPTPEVQALGEAFTSGLAKLPSYEGTVYRGASLPESVGTQYRTGNVVQEDGIMSTTWKSTEKFKDKVNYDVQIECGPNSSGKNIAMFSDKPTECEVAFPPGVRFQVIDRHLPGVEAYLGYGGSEQSWHDKHPKVENGMAQFVIHVSLEEV